MDHPNIIPIFEAGEANGVLFIAMRFVHGPNVQELVEAEGPLPAARACHIITQVAAALEAAHSHGLVHRDVKPGNILLDAAGGGDHPGHAYLSDFGLSKRALSVSALTSTGQFLGTLDYIAPEQIEARAVNGRTDEYALACSAYTMLTGQPPFVRDESVAVMWAQISAPPPELTSRRPDLPAAVDEVMAKALAKVAVERYATCPEFAVALRRACGLDSSGTDPGLPGVVPGPPPREATRIVGIPADPGQGGPGDTSAGPDGIPAGPGDTSAGPDGIPAGPGDTYTGPWSEPWAATSLPPADLPAADHGPDTELAGPASGETPRYEYEFPAPETHRPQTPPGGPGGPPAGEPAPWDSLYREPPPQEPQAGAGAGARVPDATRDVPLVTPGGYPAPPQGPPPAFRRVAPPPPSGPGGSHRGRWALIALGAVVVVVAAVLYVAKPFSPGNAQPAGSSQAESLAVPGCTTRTAKGSPLGQVTSHLVQTGGNPFDVATAPGFAFVSGAGNGLAVMNTSKAVPSLMWSSGLSHAQGEALTPDGRYLVVTGGSGITVFQVSSLEQQAGASPVGSLTSPGQQHAEDVAITPNGRYAFVTFQNSAHVGVFKLKRALTSGFGPADFVGLIKVGPQPIGIAMAPDGQHAYVASGLDNPSTPGAGVLSVIDVAKAEQHPGSAMMKTIPAGCKPNRIEFSNGGQDLWVTAVGSNALLGFSTAKLLSDPGHALLARVAVGQSPLGLAIISHGSRIVVADSNKVNQPGSTPNLAVVSVDKALAGKPALLGYVQSGLQPRQFAVSRGTLLVANTKSGQVQAIRMDSLP